MLDQRPDEICFLVFPISVIYLLSLTQYIENIQDNKYITPCGKNIYTIYVVLSFKICVFHHKIGVIRQYNKNLKIILLCSI